MSRNKARLIAAEVVGGGAAALVPSLMTGVTAYWTLDESSDGSGAVTRLDSLGISNLTDNGTTASAAGIISNGADFELANAEEWLSAASSATLQTGDISFTFSIWVKLESVVTHQWIAQKWGSLAANKEWLLRYNVTTHRFEFLWYINNTGTAKTVVANELGAPSADTWYHIVCRRDNAADTITIIVNNGAADTIADATSGNTGAGEFLIGKSADAASPLYLDGIADEAGMWKRLLSAAEISDLYNGGAGNTYPFTLVTSKAITFDGNSQTDDATSTYPAAVMTALGAGWYKYNFGVSGQTTAQMIADGVAQVDPNYRAEYSKNIVVCWEGTNALKLGATAAEAYADIVTYCQARQAAGFKVVVLTILPRSDVGTPGTFEADRGTVNTNIVTNWATFANALADVAANTTIGEAGDETNATYYSDRVHMTEAGYAIVAGIVATAVQSL